MISQPVASLGSGDLGSGTLPRHRPPARLEPDPDRIAGLLVRAWFEIRSGRRALHQLDGHLSPAVRRRLRAILARQAPLDPGSRPRVHRVVGCGPAPGVREVCVLMEHGGRLTAVAVRLERHRHRWRATELTSPEAGLVALPTTPPADRMRPRDAFDDVFDEADEPLPDHLR